ncbi:MAG: hypothetical protein ACK5N8_08220 [Alphaproteobacteria bacterium]
MGTEKFNFELGGKAYSIDLKGKPLTEDLVRAIMEKVSKQQNQAHHTLPSSADTAPVDEKIESKNNFVDSKVSSEDAQKIKRETLDKGADKSFEKAAEKISDEKKAEKPIEAAQKANTARQTVKEEHAPILEGVGGIESSDVSTGEKDFSDVALDELNLMSQQEEAKEVEEAYSDPAIEEKPYDEVMNLDDHTHHMLNESPKQEESNLGNLMGNEFQKDSFIQDGKVENIVNPLENLAEKSGVSPNLETYHGIGAKEKEGEKPLGLENNKGKELSPEKDKSTASKDKKQVDLSKKENNKTARDILKRTGRPQPKGKGKPIPPFSYNQKQAKLKEVSSKNKAIKDAALKRTMEVRRGR